MLQLLLSKQLRCARGCKAGFAAGTMARIWCRIWWVFQTLTESPMIKEVGRNAGTGLLASAMLFSVRDPAWSMGHVFSASRALQAPSPSSSELMHFREAWKLLRTILTL